MTNYIDALFLMQFLIFFGLIGTKLLNVFRQGSLYKMDIFILTWVSLVFTWGIGFICMIINYETWTMGILFSIESLFFIFSLVLFFAELFMYIGNNMIPRYNSKKEMGLR